MSIPLKDFRVAIPEDVHIWLESEAVAFGRDMQSVAREVLEEWARRKAHAHTVAAQRFAANGVRPESGGGVMGDDGTARRRS